MRLLCIRPANAGEQNIKLQNYASHFWAHHFCDIDLDMAVDKESRRALEGLHRISTNDGGASLALEVWGAPVYVALEKELRLVDKIKSCLRKADKIASLDSVVKEWAASHVAEPNKALLSLGRAHVENLLKSNTSTKGLSCFDFSRSALLVGGTSIETTDSGDKDIFQVLNSFGDMELTAGGYHAIAYITQEREEFEKSI